MNKKNIKLRKKSCDSILQVFKLPCDHIGKDFRFHIPISPIILHFR